MSGGYRGEGALPPNASAIAEPSASTTPPPAQFDAAALRHLEVLLVPVLGPIAGRVIKDISRKHANLADLCSELATQFAGNKGRTKFFEQCRQQFGLAVVPASTSAAKAPPPPEPTSGLVWDPAMLEKTKKGLAVYIGPMAKFIVDSTAREATLLLPPARCVAKVGRNFGKPRIAYRFGTHQIKIPCHATASG